MFRRIILVLLFVMGVALLTAVFRYSQTSAASARPHCDNALTERQRTYLDRHTDVTKWLIALSYAMLGGLVSKSFGSKHDPRIGSFSCSIGIILLLLSLYAGFLSYESLLLLMAEYPLSYIGSDLTAFPVGAQMVLLLAATIALAYSFLRSPATHSHTKGIAHESGASKD
ncbi:MAG: hypothetical protein ACLGSD_00335 [Acidobacteriota bacterium]